MKSFYGLLMLSAAGGLFLSGCAKSEPAAPVAEATQASDGHDHGGWWCPEHGVPEEICALCSSKAAADCKAKGDWCAEHDRPDSQCFVCHPEHEAKFAAQYEAKYGEKPPAREM
ncbi:MAG: RND transporter [Pirellulales bacterium]|nr:RND transporter [Pirellulales bacterium]